MLGVTTTGSLKKAIIGMVLGDGYMQPKTQNVRMETASICLPYVEWKKKLLEQLTEVKIYQKPGWKSDKPLYKLLTRTHPIYTKLYPHLYHDRKKTIDEFILKQIDGLALLFWFLDDGNYYKDKRGGLNLKLATDNFNYAEHLLIQKVLNDKLQLRWNIIQHWQKQRNKRYFFLQLKAKDRLKFYNLIEPYIQFIPKEMLYKIPTKIDILSSRTRYEDIV